MVKTFVFDCCSLFWICKFLAESFSSRVSSALVTYLKIWQLQLSAVPYSDFLLNLNCFSDDFQDVLVINRHRFITNFAKNLAQNRPSQIQFKSISLVLANLASFIRRSSISAYLHRRGWGFFHTGLSSRMLDQSQCLGNPLARSYSRSWFTFFCFSTHFYVSFAIWFVCYCFCRRKKWWRRRHQ